MLQYRSDTWINGIEKGFEKVLEIVKDPEHFILDRYYMSEVPKGFRIEIFIAKRFTSLCDNLKQFSDIYLNLVEDYGIRKEKMIDLIPIKKLKDIIENRSAEKHTRKTFCPYCEKLVIPKQLHKIDHGDIILSIFTGGFWIIFLLVLYIFLRRCPICNYNLRGIRPQKKR